jgi:hypothetical protein
MIQDITIPARLCQCEALLNDGTPCLYEWISIATLPPTHCMNRECRSREWNGKKPKRVPEKKAVVILPKPIKVRGIEEDEDF